MERSQTLVQRLLEGSAPAVGEETVITKEEMLEAIQRLPDDATVEDAMGRLYLLHKIEQGVAQADTGHKVSQAEARRRMKG